MCRQAALLSPRLRLRFAASAAPIAGTRGASDTVEVASQLFEYFAADPRVFRGALAAKALEQHQRSEHTFAALDVLKQVRPLISTHASQICPYSLGIRERYISRKYLCKIPASVTVPRLCPLSPLCGGGRGVLGIRLPPQVFYARLDQEMHGASPPRGAAAVDAARELAADTLPWEPPPGACPQAYPHTHPSDSQAIPPPTTYCSMLPDCESHFPRSCGRTWTEWIGQGCEPASCECAPGSVCRRASRTWRRRAGRAASTTATS